MICDHWRPATGDYALPTDFSNTQEKFADLIYMLTLLFLFALKVTTPAEMACVGSVQHSTLPRDLYIAGMEQEGILTYANEGQVIYLNGPRVSQLKPGMVQRVVRPEGKVRNRSTGDPLGLYYVDIGRISIEAVYQDSATARVILACQGMIKGDLVLADTPKPTVEFSGTLSNEITPIPRDGLVGSILLGKNDAREMAAGHFCFIGLGENDGVKVGDRFTVFRYYPKYNPQDMDSAGAGTDASYSQIGGPLYRYQLNGLLHRRSLPPQILGDIVVVEAGENVSTCKIINSLSEIHLGDLVVKR